METHTKQAGKIYRTPCERRMRDSVNNFRWVMALGRNPAPFTSNRPLVCRSRQQERGSLATAPIDRWINAERSLYSAGTRQSILTQIYGANDGGSDGSNAGARTMASAAANARPNVATNAGPNATANAGASAAASLGQSD